MRKFKSKNIEPKIYALMVKVKQGQFLWLEAAYSLESAFAQAKKYLSDIHRDIDFSTAKIELFNHEELDTLISRSVEVKEETQAPLSKAKTAMKKDTVSALMLEIVEKKDRKLFEDNKNIFTKPQVQFLEDKLKSK